MLRPGCAYYECSPSRPSKRQNALLKATEKNPTAYRSVANAKTASDTDSKAAVSVNL